MSDPILFEAYDGTGDGSGDARLSLPALRAFAYNDVVELGRASLPALTVYAVGTITRLGQAAVRLELDTYASNRVNAGYARLPRAVLYARDTSIVPTVELGYVTLPGIAIHAVGTITRTGNAAVTLPQTRVLGLEETNIVAVTLPSLHAYAPEVVSLDRYVAVIQSAGFMVARVSGPRIEAQASDTVLASDASTSLLTITAFDAASVRGDGGTSLTGTSTAVEVIAASDLAAAVLELIASSAAVAVDDAGAAFNMLLAAADLVLATGAVGASFTNAAAYVASLAEISDRADPIILLSVDDTLAALDAAASERIGLLLEALDAGALTDTAASTLSLVAIAADSGEASDSALTSLEALAAALDAGVVSGRVRAGNDTYSVYAMTFLGAAVSEYANFDFDSYATIDGHLYGASENGTFLLEGEDDAGANIDASVYGGLSALGTQLKKACPYAYIGLTTNGSMLLKVSTTDDGTKKTNVYKLNPIAKSAVSDNRFQISKGLHAVYWGFELANLDGADFELETIKVWRMPLNRRK